MTPRENQLATYVKMCLADERESTMHADVKRQATIAGARDVAADIGFAPDEIASAVDSAIKAASAEVVT